MGRSALRGVSRLFVRALGRQPFVAIKPRPSETVRHSARTRTRLRAFLASHGRWPLPVRLACLRQIEWLVMADVGKLGHVLLVAGSCQPRTAGGVPWGTLG